MSASEQDTQPPAEHGPSVTREKIFHYPAHFLAPNWNRKPGSGFGYSKTSFDSVQ